VSPAEARSFLAQFDEARAEVKRMKETMPYVFREWQQLKAAEETAKQANEQLERARVRWEAL
jgi:hypothetical protein